MIERIYVNLKVHQTTAQRVVELFNQVKTALHADYGKGSTAPGFTSKLNAAKAEMEKAIAESKKSTIEACRSEIQAVKDAAIKKAAAPADPAFISTLEALRTIKNPGEMELAAIAGAYKGNYILYRALSDQMGKARITLDDVLQDCDQLAADIENVVNGSVDSHGYATLLQGDFLGYHDDIFTAFCDSRYDDALAIKNTGPEAWAAQKEEEQPTEPDDSDDEPDDSED